MTDQGTHSPMLLLGYHASHEQFPPSELLRCTREAESAGFARAMCSDHFAPWSERQGHSGFSWAWLGASMAQTTLPHGVVTAPGQRMHPVLVAQAAATLAEMFPGRFWLALGSGEAMNEHITGDPWPEKRVRRERLRECVDVMRALFAGEAVSHDGLVRVDRARLYTRPAQPPLMLAAAVSEESAAWAGGWADGLVTVAQPREVLARVLRAFRENGGAGKRVALQVHVSYAKDEAAALANAHDQWRFGVLSPDLLWDLTMPEHFDAATKFVRPEDVRDAVRISSDLARHAAWIAEDFAMGFDEVYLHDVGRDQRGFIDAFGAHVVPQFRG